MRPPFHLVVRLCLRAATASPLWSVDIGIYVQFYLCPILFYLQKKNTIKNKEVRGVLHKWLTFDYLLEFCMGRSLMARLVPEAGLFSVLVFIFEF